VGSDGGQEPASLNFSFPHSLHRFISGEQMQPPVAFVQGIYFFIPGVWPLIA
jgi:hypothetical protein